MPLETHMRRLQRMQKQFRVGEAAKMINVHTAHLYRLIRNGQVPVSGHHPLRISRNTLRSYIKKQFPAFKFLFPEIQ